MAPRSVLVLGTYRHSLTVIRSLARAGYRVIAGIENGRIAYGKHCRYSRAIWNHAAIEGDEAGFIQEFRSFFVKHPEVSLVFPVGDVETGLLARNPSILPGHVCPVMPSPEVVLLSHDKLKMCAIARQLSIPQKPFHRAETLTEVIEKGNRLGYPCVIRPPDPFTRILGKKVFIAGGTDRLAENLADWPFSDRPLLIQGFSRGKRHTYYFLADKGEIVAGLEARILRTDRPDGTGFAVDSLSVGPTDSVILASRRLLRHLNYSGLGCAQFLMGERDRIDTFLEINPRLGAAFRLADSCGIDFPPMAVELSLGRSFSTMTRGSGYPRGVRFGWLYGDLQGLQRAFVDREISALAAGAWFGRLLNTFLRARCHPTWTLTDPLPTAFVYSSPLVSLFKRALRPPSSKRS
jgi:predicted ATP-grasp superfamily ATP-dependent carboligase